MGDGRAKATSCHLTVLIVTNSYHLHRICMAKHFTCFSSSNLCSRILQMKETEAQRGNFTCPPVHFQLGSTARRLGSFSLMPKRASV